MEAEGWGRRGTFAKLSCKKFPESVTDQRPLLGQGRPHRRVPPRPGGRGSSSGRVASAPPGPRVPTSALGSQHPAWALARARGVRAPQPQPQPCLPSQLPDPQLRGPTPPILVKLCGGFRLRRLPEWRAERARLGLGARASEQPPLPGHAPCGLGGNPAALAEVGRRPPRGDRAGEAGVQSRPRALGNVKQSPSVLSRGPRMPFVALGRTWPPPLRPTRVRP